MSSRNAVYESSILCGFGAALVSCFAIGGATMGRLEAKGIDVFGFDFGAALSRLTRTDAGIWKAAMPGYKVDTNTHIS